MARPKRFDLSAALQRQQLTNCLGTKRDRLGHVSCPRRHRRANVSTQADCSSVSGTRTRREMLISSNALAGATPSLVNVHAAISADRPIPARQWMATLTPAFNFSASKSMSFDASGIDCGTPRSRIGNEMNSIPASTHADASPSRSSSFASLDSSKETTTSTPSRRQPVISSVNHSPARGLAKIARWPRSIGIRYSSGVMQFPGRNSNGLLVRRVLFSTPRDQTCPRNQSLRMQIIDFQEGEWRARRDSNSRPPGS
jgi:hypothetical protein